MKKCTKHILLVAFLILSFNLSAQDANKKISKIRTVEAQILDKKIELFISENFSKYRLTPAKESEIKKDFEGTSSKSHQNISKILEDIKKYELRKLYFKQNPETEEKYNSARLWVNDTIHYVCANGGLEDGYDDGYSFTNGFLTPPYSCNLDISGLTPLAPSVTVNDFNASVTLVNDDITVSNGFDPVLNGLAIPVEVERINSGSSAIKLNNNSERIEVTTMSRLFNKTGNIVSYSFSYITQSLLGASQDLQSHFIVRLYRENGELLSQNCIYADAANPLFTSVPYGSNPNVQLLYTNWQCGTILTQGVPQGELLRLEFTVTDPGNGGYGTVYIDDICDNGSCNPSYGKINLLLSDIPIECPAFPLQVCGTYSLPFTSNTDPVITGTLDSLILNVYQNGLLLNTVSNYQLSGDQFCFELAESDFGVTPVTGDFEFEAVLEGVILNFNYVVIDNSARIGPDASFNNCDSDCEDYLTITTPVASGIDQQQAEIGITASNVISSGASALYHAGLEILLVPGLDALNGSTDHFYIQGCSNDAFVQRYSLQNQEEKAAVSREINLISVNSSSLTKVYPNPAKNVINITGGTAGVKSVKITALDGKQIENRQFGNDDVQNVYTIDVSGISKGIYILTTETSDGQITSYKIIKE